MTAQASANSPKPGFDDCRNASYRNENEIAISDLRGRLQNFSHVDRTSQASAGGSRATMMHCSINLREKPKQVKAKANILITAGSDDSCQPLTSREALDQAS
jgi:hypothetical protein